MSDVSFKELLARSSIGHGLRQLAAHRLAEEAERVRRMECTCPVEHSITKLGHNAHCPHRGRFRPARVCVSLSHSCPPTHMDGSPHDFEWATYADDHSTYGVCRCGFTSLSDSMWGAP